MDRNAVERATGWNRLGRYREDGTAQRWEWLQAHRQALSDPGATRNHTVGNGRRKIATVGEESRTNDGKHEHVVGGLAAMVWAIIPSGPLES